ncbi:fructose-bisphosphate aldolase class II [Mycoplasma testudineum]|uniref:Fructose-bisphosphate aldolase class II n=1 Tax=Mycoplasma testudineum TaxID=244584 RepID=A0A4R6IDI9_9MOLU|nr:ketose-bisphosphate aldolase [Mycoplasma testudineum]OYD26474.1 fructose-bisphosphate aldolase [Mycoplasma testudineum]TDO18965.1 fructose-bisphosphate aldolase class II [Mycoplasma testudineum]
MPLVNSKILVKHAYENGYAIPHFNMNNLEIAKAILESAQENNSPVIIAATHASLYYMGGVNSVAGLVKGLIKDLNITIPVALHLDHGQDFEIIVAALEAGFTSVMFDGSKLNFNVNATITKKVVDIAKQYDAGVEAEIGGIGGIEDGVVGNIVKADPNQVEEFKDIGVDFCAAGVNNIHGIYPENWEGLDFELISKLKQINIPLVLHGGSGISKNDVQKAIKNGISKINVNTEILYTYALGLQQYINTTDVLKNKNYDIKKISTFGIEKMKLELSNKIKEFGSYNKSNQIPI